MKKFLLIMLATVLTVTCISASAEIVMKIAGTTPANPELGEYVAMLKFAELVGEYSNGEIKGEVYPANQLGTTAEFTEGVALGTIESCVAGFDIIGSLDPSMNVMAMPYMFRDFDHQRLVLETENEAGNAIRQSLIENANMRLVAVLYRPMRVLANSRNPVKSPADMVGMTVRSPEAAANVKTIEAMGGQPVTISWAEVFTSLSQGVCDGVENAITELASINLNEIVKYVSETNHLPAPIPVLVSEAWFQSLSPELQAAVIKAGEETTKYRFELLQSEIERAWKKFADSGVEILKSDEIDMDAFRSACANVYKYFSQEKGYFSEEMYLSIVNAK